jgi:hypothetical protein
VPAKPPSITERHGALFFVFNLPSLRAVMRPAVADVVFRNERAHDGPARVVDSFSLSHLPAVIESGVAINPIPNLVYIV